MKRLSRFVNRHVEYWHDHTNTDGFAHNCLLHPLLWVSFKLERFA